MSGGRIFKIQINLDDMSASLEQCDTDLERLQWLQGFLMGGRGASPPESAPPAKKRGAEVSMAGYEAAVAFQELQSERGKKSAEARKSNGNSTTVEPRLNHGSNGTPNQSSNPVIHKSKKQINQSGSFLLSDVKALRQMVVAKVGVEVWVKGDDLYGALACYGVDELNALCKHCKAEGHKLDHQMLQHWYQGRKSPYGGWDYYYPKTELDPHMNEEQIHDFIVRNV